MLLKNDVHRSDCRPGVVHTAAQRPRMSVNPLELEKNQRVGGKRMFNVFFMCNMYSDRHTVFLQYGVGAITVCGSFCGNRKWMQHLRQILTWYGIVWYDMASYRIASYFNALYYMSNLIDLVDIQITRSWLDIFYFWEHFLCV